MFLSWHQPTKLNRLVGRCFEVYKVFIKPFGSLSSCVQNNLESVCKLVSLDLDVQRLENMWQYGRTTVFEKKNDTVLRKGFED